MRVDALHRRVAEDVTMMYDAVSTVMPPRLPRQYETRQMNVTPYLTRLSNTLAPFNITVPVHRDPKEVEGIVLFSGMWFAGGRIEVRCHLHPDTNRIVWTPKLWQRRRLFFWSLLMHELIHRHQESEHERRDNEVRIYRADATVTDSSLKEEMEYLGDCDEIEAYAHDAALELMMWYPGATLHQAIAQVKERKFTTTPPTYMIYSNAFKDKSHPAFRHFRRKLRSWFDLVHAERHFYEGMELA